MIKIAQKGLKTDLKNFKKFPKFLNRISVPSSGVLSSGGRSFSFLKTEASVRMGLKAVFMLNCCSVRFTLFDTPFT